MHSLQFPYRSIFHGFRFSIYSLFFLQYILNLIHVPKTAHWNSDGGKKNQNINQVYMHVLSNLVILTICSISLHRPNLSIFLAIPSICSSYGLESRLQISLRFLGTICPQMVRINKCFFICLGIEMKTAN